MVLCYNSKKFDNVRAVYQRKSEIYFRKSEDNLSLYFTLYTIYNSGRVIETWLLLAVLKVPIGGDGSNIQYFPGFVGGAAI